MKPHLSECRAQPIPTFSMVCSDAVVNIRLPPRKQLSSRPARTRILSYQMILAASGRVVAKQGRSYLVLLYTEVQYRGPQ